jgi:predicted transcriptional regulator
MYKFNCNYVIALDKATVYSMQHGGAMIVVYHDKGGDFISQSSDKLQAGLAKPAMGLN